MISKKKQFPFSETGHIPGQLPSVPLILSYRGHLVPVSGLLDTGATVNVLPYDIGRELGAVGVARNRAETHVIVELAPCKYLVKEREHKKNTIMTCHTCRIFTESVSYSQDLTTHNFSQYIP